MCSIWSDFSALQGVGVMDKDNEIEGHLFHGFQTPVEALNYYYENVLGGRHPDGFEYRQEKALLEWLATRG